MQPPLQSPMSEQHGHGEAGALGRGGGAGARGSAAVLYPSRDDSAAAQATPISGNRWYGAAAAPMPFCRIHGTGAPEADGSHGLGAATDSWTDADDLSPIHARRGFTGGSGTSHGRTFNGGFTGGSGTSSISPAFRRQPILDPAWENNSHPPGGFMGILNSQANFVGAPSHYSPFKAPRFSSMDASSAPDMDREKQPAVVDVDKQPAAVDRDNENVRTEKRILWTAKEDERLMSAWIKHSTDSTTGADRKGEAYWGDVIDEYNKKTAPQRARNAKQAKDRWHKINKLCDLFECAYLKARRVYTSGYSDQMWMEAAEDFYVEDSKNDEGKPVLGPFTLKNVWKMCCEEPKWKTYNEGLKNARKRKSYHLEEEGEVNEDSADETPKRPIGQKAAKKAALAAKGKSKEVNEDGKSKNSAIDVDKVDRLGKIQECANADRMKILELQKKLSSDKIETTKIAHLTAQENRESKKLEMEGKKLEMEAKKIEMEGKKLEKESKMMDAYNSLISQDTSSMTDEEKVERVAAMKCLRKMLFPEIF